MAIYRFLPMAALGAALATAPVVPVFGQDVPATDPAVTTETTTTEASDEKFADRDLLVGTMTSLDVAADPVALGDTVNALSDDQVVALNRSLNNLNRNVFTAPASFEFDGAQFDAVRFLERITEDFNKQQIRALTKALEEKIKFLYLADKTGNDRFLDLADRQERKFLAKVDRFATEAGPGSTAENSGTDLTVRTLRSTGAEARGQARTNARRAARDTAKNAAKRAAKSAIKRDIKDQAKKAARGGRRS